ncbi:ABC-type oligopeptide transport system, periplasmic component [Longilinea arvoryzae]|uniref:ABC-type oligopeptide transport system, periplasmic component n=1 Tax=Longilinea arvoryzae TaxID=360412 RepID=A0A0S7BK40_9CHLR|nr:carboxypeptidase regulatory-like domain-containing protein [Longilinea arvoryzae]GAP14177.1 ABC-type oligopeptide transport system, periplasmic component [Longilinea arvoryzae]
MASQTHLEAQVRCFPAYLGRILLTIIITIGLLGISIPPVQAAGETITGRVTSSVNNQPIAGVTVYANEYESDQNVGDTTTAADGSYTLVVNPGTYRVRACPGCNGPTSYANTYAGGTPVWGDDEPIQVGIDQHYPLDFSLDPGGSISGVITDSNGHPISGMTMAVINDNNRWVDGMQTGDDGSYTFFGVPYGNFRVLACGECDNPTLYVSIYYPGVIQFEAAGVLTVGEGLNPSNIDFQVPLGNSIQGTVTDNATPGTALVGITMGAVQWDGATSQWTWFKSVDTASDGSYNLAGLPDGDYRVQACPECSGKYYLGEYYDSQTNIDSSTNFSLSGGSAQTGVNFTLEPAAIITGHVTDRNGSALPNVPVSAENTVDGSNFNTWTDGEGNYALNARPGNYIVHTQLNWNSDYNQINLVDEYFDHVASLDQASPLSLTARTTTSGIDFSLRPGNTIQGSVSDTSETPRPLSGIMVAALKWDTDEWLKNVLTDENGNYTMTGLADGTYRIQACPDCVSQPYVSRYYNNTPDYGAATPLVLSGAGTTSGINFTLDPAGIISGHVTAADGTTSLSNIPVYAENSQTYAGFNAWTDQDGNYSIFVTPGYYRLRTMVGWNSDLDGMNYVDQIYDHVVNLEEAPIIQATAGQTTSGHDFALEQGGALSGTISDDQGTPLENATVMAVAADGSRRSYGSQATGPDGIYTLRGLPAGNYILRASHEGSQALYYGGNPNWNTDHPVTITIGATNGNINFGLPVQGGEDPNLLTMRQSATIADMIDPGWVEYVQNAYLVDQIFSGMTRINPADGSTLSNLSDSASWQSGDNTHWTFSLRNGLTWSDGSPLTAADIRFALLRNLKMDGVVDDMLIIQGAEAYRNGTADADQVGITLDTADPGHIIHFTLTQKVAFFPTLLSTMAARPLPQLLIQAFPDSWTSLDKLVTSGPYRLMEWDGAHVLLQKNPNFIDADKVQIQQVVMKSGSSTDQAWNQYLSGELDTAVIPPSHIADAKNDPAIQDQLNLVAQQCTFFAGFSSSEIESTLGLTGANAALFRRALIEAVDRDAFTTQTVSGTMPAWTYIAPGVLGHSDETSGIYPAYDPTQALEDIQAAFSGNYTGLPAIPLYYADDAPNAGAQQDQMEFLATAWNQTLNAHFTVEGISQQQYTDKILAGQMLVARRGWCSDYNDGYNFLSSMYSMDAIFGGWQNDAYDALLSSAASSTTETERRQYYQQAEEILLKTDAVLMPLYYSVSPNLSRGFVRSFGVGGVDYIADWTLERTDTTTVGVPTSAALGAPASTEFSPNGEEGRVSYSIPAGGFTDGTTLIHTGLLTYDLTHLPEGMQKTSLYFTFKAEDATHQPVMPAADYTLSVHYAQTEIDALNLTESSLSLYYWDAASSRWVKDPNSHIDTSTNTITTTTRHEGEWLVLGSDNSSQVFLPFITR